MWYGNGNRICVNYKILYSMPKFLLLECKIYSMNFTAISISSACQKVKINDALIDNVADASRKPFNIRHYYHVFLRAYSQK